MTDVREHRVTTVDPAETRPVPLLAGALTTSLWAVVVGIAPLAAVVLVVWVAGASTGTGATDAVRFSLGGWLLAHGVPLRVGGATLGLAPLGLTALAVWQLVRAGTNTARAVGAGDLRGGVRVVAAVAATYGLAGGLVALLAGSEHLSVPVLRSAVSTFAVAVLAAGAGVLRVEEIRAEVAERLGTPVVDVLRAGSLAAAGVLGTGTLVTAVQVLLSVDHAAELVRALEAGPVGTAGLLVLCVLYVPTVAVWGTAYLVGPGFALGTGTSVTAFGVHVGPLPAVPLLAGVPVDPLSGSLVLLFTFPIAMGLLAGVRIARSAAPHVAGWAALLRTAALTGPVAGVLVGAAALAAGGPLGDGRLAAVGPSAWRVAVACALGVSLTAMAGASIHRGLVTARSRAARNR
jgi:hypothetical protein